MGDVINKGTVTMPVDTGEDSYAIEVEYKDNSASFGKEDEPIVADDSTANTNRNADSKSDEDKSDEDKDKDDTLDETDTRDNSDDNNKSKKKADTSSKSAVQKRIDTLTKRWRTAEREIADLRTENRTLRSVDKNEANKFTKPNVEDFDDPNLYMDALVDWKIETAQVKRNADQSSNIEQSIQNKTAEIEQSKQKYVTEVLDAAKEKYKDFDSVFTDDVTVSNDMMDSMLLLDNLDDVAYYLGKNRDKATEISKLPKLATAMALQRISSTLGAKKVSKGPAPITPVKGSSTNKSLESMSFKEYRAEMEKREKLGR